MKRTIAKHKTTAVGIITAVLLFGGAVKWFFGDIDAVELGAYAGAVGSIAVTVLGLLSKDGQIKKKDNGEH